MMPTLQRLELIHIAVPLKKAIRHASHERTTSESLVVRAVLTDGSEGFGEGVPRPYVTGETVGTTFDALASFDAARLFGRPASFEEAVEGLSRFSLPEIDRDPRGMFGNAARAALEIALLDASCRSFGRSFGEAVRLAIREPALRTSSPQPVRYSGAITADTLKQEIISAYKMRIYGFHQVKLKVGVTGQDDPARLGKIRRILGRKVDIRIDANEGWDISELLDRVSPLRAFHVSALEQPVPHAQIDLLAGLRPGLDMPIMLDESLCGFPDGLRAIETRTADLFNVRISKCGGIGPSLRLIELAHRSGLGVQLGCHPGETGLLSAAGRHLASNIQGLRYVEGSYDRHVLARNLTRDDPTFGYGGRAMPIQGPGLGVTVDPEALSSMTVGRREIRYD